MSSLAASLDELEDADEQPPTPVAVPDLLKQPAKSPKEPESSLKDAKSGQRDAVGGPKGLNSNAKDPKPAAEIEVGSLRMGFGTRHGCSQQKSGCVKEKEMVAWHLPARNHRKRRC